MSNILEISIERLGLKRIKFLDEILIAKSFFFDSNYDSEIEFPVYPLTKKANLTHNLLNLYGTHWRYLVDIKTHEIKKVDGDENRVLDDLMNGCVVKRHANYAFSQNYVNNEKSLWVLNSHTPESITLQNNLISIFKTDLEKYKQNKQIILSKTRK